MHGRIAWPESATLRPHLRIRANKLTGWKCSNTRRWVSLLVSGLCKKLCSYASVHSRFCLRGTLCSALPSRSTHNTIYFLFKTKLQYTRSQFSFAWQCSWEPLERLNRKEQLNKEPISYIYTRNYLCTYLFVYLFNYAVSNSEHILMA
jgi:hypothetical protein